jgi:hypothetical protein
MNNIFNHSMINNNAFDDINLDRPMEQGISESWLGKYFWVRLPVNDRIVVADRDAAARAWCIENFGATGRRWNMVKQTDFYFRDERDLTMFLLKWS